MAVVGEAHILVRAVTKGVKDDIKRALSGISGEAEAAGDSIADSLGKGFNGGSHAMGKFSRESEALAREFHKNIRNSYKFQAAIGSAIQSVSVLANGLLALIGNMAGAASSAVVLVGVMAQLKITALVGKQAFSGIAQAVQATTGKSSTALQDFRRELENLKFAMEEAALAEIDAGLKLEEARENFIAMQQLPPNSMARRQAELAYRQADLAYRQAKEKVANMGNEIEKVKKRDPFGELTKTQRQFATYLRTVVPRLKELKEAAASSFLPVLQEQIQKIFSSGVFGILVKGFRDVSKGLASASRSFIGTLFDPKNKQNLGDLFKGASKTAAVAGKIFGNVFSAFLTLMKAIDPLINRFTAFLDKKSFNLSQGLSNNFAEVSGFFRNAGQAAAGWGELLGRIFKKFKSLIMANVGPGSGGQLLLEWMNRGVGGFKGLDGAAGEFARKNYFLQASKNFIAMGSALGRIFSFMSNLAADPNIARFWEILGDLEGPINEIFAAITTSSDELARLLVSILDVVAAFADSGQLETYMGMVAALFEQIAAMINMLKPMLQTLGPIVGAVGALITSFLILKKVMMLVWGTVMILRRAFVLLMFTKKAYIVITKTLAVLEARKNAAIAAGTVLTNAQAKATILSATKSQLNAVAKGAEATGNVLVGTTAKAAIPGVAGLTAAIATLGAPILLTIGALAALGLALWAYTAAQEAARKARLNDAVKALTKTFNEHRDAALGVKEAYQTWNDATLSVEESSRNAVSNVKELGNNLRKGFRIVVNRAGGVKLSKEQLEQLPKMDVGSDEYQAAITGLNAYLTGLSRLGKKDLPLAQRELRNLVFVGNIDRESLKTRILLNSSYVGMLEKQANALGDTIKGADGAVDAQKALDYAIGEGTYKTRIAAIERAKFNQIVKDAIQTFIDVKGPLQQNLEDIKKYGDTVYNSTKTAGFSLKKYKEDIKAQGDDLKNWMTNLNALAGNIKGDLFNKLVAMGKDGMGLVKSLVTTKNGIVTVNQQAVKEYVKGQTELINAQKNAEFMAAGLTDPEVLKNILKAKFKGWSGEQKAALVTAENIAQMAEKYGVTFDQLAAEAKAMGSQVDLAQNVDISAAWEDGTLEGLRDALIDNFKGVTIKLKKGQTANDWYLDTYAPAPNGATGGLFSFTRRFAPGGYVSGPGGPTSDRVPAMLSNGEFVVNAAATDKNLALLQAINSGATLSGSPVNILVNPSPKADEVEIANEVSRRLAFSLRRGA